MRDFKLHILEVSLYGASGKLAEDNAKEGRYNSYLTLVILKIEQPKKMNNSGLLCYSHLRGSFLSLEILTPR